MKRHLLLVVSAGLLTVAVGLVVSLVVSPEERPADTVKPLPPPSGFRAEMLADSSSEGARAFIRICTQCHDLPNPKMHTSKEWPQIVHRMITRLIRRKALSMSPTPLYLPSTTADAQIVTYLKENGSKAMTATMQGDSTAVAVLFKSRCGQCHLPPDPAQHSADAWPAIVDRMRKNIATDKRTPITDAERMEIVAFLSAWAGKTEAGTR